MTVYVDKYPEWIAPAVSYWGGGGHLFGTDLEELHQFARLIGIKREWYQYVGFPHYDLTRNKRSLAIMKGAKRIAPGLIPKGVILYDPNNG